MAHPTIRTSGPLHGEVLDGPEPRKAPTSIEVLDWLSLLMDRLFPLPGTRMRFGLNSVFLLLPVLGDVIPTMVSGYILAAALAHHRVPKIVGVRMMLNSLLDAALGWIPIVGDAFDLFFKADTRNVNLLKQYAISEGPPPSTFRHWAFVLGIVGVLCLTLMLVMIGVAALVYWLVHMLRAA